jgi:hypothetical protein
MTTKQKLQHLIDQLPENCSLEQVEYRIGIMRMLEERLAEVDDPATECIPHEEVVRQMRAKWQPE